MTPEQIREIVRITLDELEQRRQLNMENYQSILKVVDKELSLFFCKRNPTKIGYALTKLSDDPYIDIIFLQYRDSKTLEWIAEYMEKDVSTIKRNKKRLILTIYDLMRDV